MHPTLAIAGINHRTSLVEVRERFWIGDARPEQDQLTAAIRKLFRLPKPARTERVVAGLAPQLHARSQ